MSHARLNQLKQELLDLCDSPEVLLCPIQQDVPQQFLVTPNGLLFGKNEILSWIQQKQICPISRDKLRAGDLHSSDNLDIMATIIRAQHSHLTNAIKHMTLEDEEKIRDKIDGFNALVKITDESAAKELEAIRQPALITALKNRLQIDINNETHLYFWHQQCNTKIDNFIPVEHRASRNIFNIPKLIFDLMMIAVQPHATKAELKSALDAHRKTHNTYPSLFANPFSNLASYLRKPAGSDLCNIDDIEKLKFGK